VTNTDIEDYLLLTNSDRLMIFLAMSQAPKCATCGSGPVDSTDIHQIITYGRVWDTLKLDELEGMNQEKLNAFLLDKDQVLRLDITQPYLDFLLRNILGRSYVYNVFSMPISLVHRLCQVAKEAELNLPDVKRNFTTKEFTFSSEDYNIFAQLLCSKQACDAQFTLQNGQQVSHGAARDFPKSLPEFRVYSRLVQQLGLVEYLEGTDLNLPVDDGRKVELDDQTVDLLKRLITGRSSSVTVPLYKIARTAGKL
jgi:hypothetical protein